MQQTHQDIGAGAIGRNRRSLIANRLLPYLLVLPAVTIVFGMTLYPTVHVLRSSLTDWSLNRIGTEFIGLQNYRWLLTDPQFWLTLRNTVVFSLGVLFLVLTLGMLLALALNEKLPLRTFFRSAAIMPWAITAVVTGLMWRWMLLPDIGILTYLLEQVGLRVPFLLNSTIALGALIVIDAWRSTGYGMVLLLAGLQGIDTSLHDAAKVDGASYAQYVRHIVIPLLVPTLIVVAILISIHTINLIDIVLVVTGGGPARQTETLGLFMWKESFQLFSVGYGSAIAVIMFGI
ncbi:MAG: sugar ABC transporter permease, partial [Thermomicrobiales bacterium]|nr:sugar ABC transporter permease [Thermomicrobiales bacterium]